MLPTERERERTLIRCAPSSPMSEGRQWKKHHHPTVRLLELTKKKVKVGEGEGEGGRGEGERGQSCHLPIFHPPSSLGDRSLTVGNGLKGLCISAARERFESLWKQKDTSG